LRLEVGLSSKSGIEISLVMERGLHSRRIEEQGKDGFFTSSLSSLGRGSCCR